MSSVLFNIYTFDLPSPLTDKGIGCTAFADDLKRYYPVGNYSKSVVLQQVVDIVSAWSERWGLPLSVEKTKILHIEANNKNYFRTSAGNVIEVVCQAKDLGFLVSNDLSFNAQCEMIDNKVTRVMCDLFRALTTEKKPLVLVHAYETYVRPILEYGTPIFTSSRYTSISKLDEVRNHLLWASFMMHTSCSRTSF